MNIKNCFALFLGFSLLVGPMGVNCMVVEAPVESSGQGSDEKPMDKKAALMQWLEAQKKSALHFYQQHQKAIKLAAGLAVGAGLVGSGYYMFGPATSGNDAKQLSSSSSSEEYYSAEYGSGSSESGDEPSIGELEAKKQQEEGDRKLALEIQGKQKDKTYGRDNDAGAVVAGLQMSFYKSVLAPEARDHKNEFTLQQFKVVSQFSSGGGNASCAYQAFLRACQFVAAKAKGADDNSIQQELLKSDAITQYFYKPMTGFIGWLFGEKTPMGQWREEIIERRKKIVARDAIRTLCNESSGKDENKKKVLCDAQNILANELGVEEDNYALATSSVDKAIITPFEKLNDSLRGDWLEDGEIEYLIRQHTRDIIPSDVPCYFHIVHNFDTVGTEFDELTPFVRDEVCPHLNQKDVFFVFLLGDMETGGEEEGPMLHIGGGHWWPLIGVTDGKGNIIDYTVMDSASNHDRTDDDRVLSVIEVIRQ